MPCKSILIVDDDEDIRENVAMALQAEDYEIHKAENGKTALTFLKSLSHDELPGCIILDLMMPEMNGIEFMQALKAEPNEALRAISILIATAKDSPIDRNTCDLELEKIRKPFELDELYEVVKKHCGSP